MSLLSDQVDQKEINVIIRELERVISNGVPGDVVEFGCYVGTTSVYIAQVLAAREGRQFYTYDSFAGLPEKSSQDVSPLGIQFKAGELLASKKQFIKNMMQAGVPVPRVKKAWFSDLTLSDVPNSVAFAYLDGDYYRSVLDPLKLLDSVLAPGATIVVDDYSNAALPGVAKAVDEWLHGHPAQLKVEQSLAIIYTKR
ncbi:MAG: TylF/MycF/NovP-related O-methyltransferase [Candidatus Saccharimonadales bacterium]